MLKNNIEVKCIGNGLTHAQLAQTVGTTNQYVNRIIKKQYRVVNKTFVQMFEALEYDVELTYMKKEVKPLCMLNSLIYQARLVGEV